MTRRTSQTSRSDRMKEFIYTAIRDVVCYVALRAQHRGA